MKPGAFSKHAHRFAQIGICVQFLALVRTLIEVFRLQFVHKPTLPVANAAPYAGAGLLAALLTWAAVICYFAGRDRVALGVVGVTILVLIIIKIVCIPA